ncbi:MAG: DNA replication/repair protein RecF [Anaerolineales bacterium]
MFLTHLSLTDFRIFSRFDQDLTRNALILVGDNAQGKTTLLEAVYYLSALDSFQASNTVDLINFTALQKDLAVGRIVADFTRKDGDHHLEIRLIRDIASNGNQLTRKEVLLDGTQRKINDVIGQFNAVMFLPHMLQILTGSPQERRRYLDMTISQVDHQYADTLSEYNKALMQRNALLKQLAERSNGGDQLSYWDEMLTRSGSYLMHSRILAVQELESQAASIHQELTRGTEILRMSYQPSYDPQPNPPGQIELPLDSSRDLSNISLEELRDGFREKTLARREEDIARGVTTLGPHRDDLRFLSNAVDLGNFGSRGQLRTTLLSIKLAEVNWLKDRNGEWPVLLLDEVLAELDDTRRQDLLERLSRTEQALLTTTDLDLFSEGFRKSSGLWKIDQGELVS